MGISQKDIKLLWGRAASRCSFPDCRVRLTEDKSVASESFPLGEQAHIVAEEPHGPRGASSLSTEERDSYFNLILLCPTHHTLVDRNAEDYPVERLHMAKAEHELWVERTLSEIGDARKLARDLVYSTVIDSAVENCRFAEWAVWTSWALGPLPYWAKEAEARIYAFRDKVMSAVWPGTLPELERALQTLAAALFTALNEFLSHASPDGEWMRAVPFYKIGEFNPERYHELVDQFERWVDDCTDLAFEATKAANWVADVVRRDFNPLFFAAEGKFLVEYGPNAPDFSFRTRLLEYTEEERAALPDAFVKKRAAIEDARRLADA